MKQISEMDLHNRSGEEKVSDRTTISALSANETTRT